MTSRTPSPRTRRPAPAPLAGQDVPLTVLVPSERVPDRSLHGLATRLATSLGHAVEPWSLDRPAKTLAAIGRHLARGTARIVLLPVVAGRAGRREGSLDAALSAAVARWPSLCVHVGAPLGSDDVARILGDRAREAARSLALERSALGDVVAVIVDSGGASPAGNAELAGLCRLVYEAQQFADVAYAFLDLTTPSIAEIVRRWAKLGAGAIVVAPHTLFDGVVYRRIVREVREAARVTGAATAVARPLAPHPLLVGALARRHVEALRAGPLASPAAVTTTPWVRPHLLLSLRHTHRPGPLADLEGRMSAVLPPRYQSPEVVVSAAPMGAVPLQFGADGAVAWDEMWQGFCELALAGGPPHRGTLLEAPPREEILANPARHAEVLRELERGIRLVTKLEVLPDAPPGWIGVVCHGEAMAVWMLRAIVVENIIARREAQILYLPAGPRFSLAGEVKNVITALAKSHHYWIQHVADQ